MIDDVVRASNELTAGWARHACTGPTSALSGAGLWPLLALLAAAADGPGRAELQEAVGRAADGADRDARELLEVLASGAAVDGAFGLWTRAGLPLEQWWLDAAPGGSRGELSGDPDADQTRLDEWVDRHTRGQLKRMPVRIDSDTLMVLATALSIDTKWRKPFQDIPYRPMHGPWSDRQVVGLTSGGTDLGTVSVADAPDGPVTLLKVEGEDDVDVYLCLAAPDRPPGEVLAAGVAALGGGHPVRPGADLITGPDGPKAPGVELRTIASSDPTPTLHLLTVRFDVTAEHDLLARPELFGLATVVTDAGHFPRISPVPLKVGEGRQDVTATFTARGFKAAAVTAFAMTVGSAPPQHTQEAPVLDVTFDRPFGFLARHRPTGLVLLAGWVADPDPWPADGGDRPAYEEPPAPRWDDTPPPPTTAPAPTPAPAPRGPLNALRRALGRSRNHP